MAEPDPFKPCATACVYGTCGSSGYGGCGGCCGCLGGCYAEYELEQAMIPETLEQYEQRVKWEALKDLPDFKAFPL